MPELKPAQLKIIMEDGNFVTLLLFNPTQYQKYNSEVIKFLVSKKKIPGVYVTLNRPYSIIKKIFEKEKINTNMILFIDANTSPSEKRKLEKSKGCLFIPSPQHLTDLAIALAEAVEAIPSKDKFVFFDSLSTLFVYNKAGTVAKFAHFLTSKMRVWGVKGVIVSLEKGENKSVIDQISQFTDSVLDFSGGCKK